MFVEKGKFSLQYLKLVKPIVDFILGGMVIEFRSVRNYNQFKEQLRRGLTRIVNPRRKHNIEDILFGKNFQRCSNLVLK